MFSVNRLLLLPLNRSLMAVGFIYCRLPVDFRLHSGILLSNLNYFNSFLKVLFLREMDQKRDQEEFLCKEDFVIREKTGGSQ